ncbi:hypothetical protein RRG08_021512 [Elysia crispata]|uniref:Peptidase S1 domain-containing protein n=1 Tax=Elysia crispata TaxID=231223 RepID=A0AAE1BC89_9GAST|nr:hypothetical protein RRG08_021512 [Elysia crispata]
MQLKYSAPSVAILFRLFFVPSFHVKPIQAQDINFSVELQARARSIDDLRYVIGPNFNIFIATYWRFMLVSCDVFQQQLTYDSNSQVLVKFCPILTRCPLLFQTQSCIIQASVRSIRFECCRNVDEKQNNPTGIIESQPKRPGHVEDPPLIFNLESQRTCNYMRALPTTRIIGGSATRRGEFPWVAMLLKNGAYQCVCNIMDDNHCLTAAHCFDASAPSDKYEIIAGKYTYDVNEFDVGQQRIAVARYIVHEAYNANRKENDLAMVRLSRSLTWSTYVMPACLPSSEVQLPRFCVVAGWGELQGGRSPTTLMKVEMQAYNSDHCLQVFSRTASSDLSVYVNKNTVCAANALLGGRDACRGDSGGPLMCVQRTRSGSAAYFIFGTVSNGNQCARPGEPGVYMDVREYLAWIQRVIRTSR